MINLSIIIQEHKEGREFIQKMLLQATQLTIPFEVIYVTSLSYADFYSKYGPFPFRFPLSVIANIKSREIARNAGAEMAIGENLLFMDSHVCFNNENVTRLLNTLNEHPESIVAPAVQAIEFPSCQISGSGIGYGVAFTFNEFPFNWKWLPAERTDREFKVPFVCACVCSMKKSLFNILKSYGGGLYWEEEKSMRLWRLGHPTYSEPRAIFGHYYKGYEGHTTADAASTAGYYEGQVAFIYVNVFNKALWNQIEPMLIKAHGNKYYEFLETAKKRYSWVRAKMQPFANRIEERWFLRNE